ncbi:hypothetical protein BO70DRAFT_169675 [Aspergillus heteromorphus CBS 117.55]|uniref:Uncharacterized protein n=1 Tax=Aspergillus heteromorphus CBS 117.55 TaxID=1448321 RepID=A0A317V4M8_9EURO|nr:uncharacterized protein BO70DRAFT_169675 [Aspergillus heteromorphus CBS 117.55]PWY67150.1 hypothetical protein BO70DRAFT_169675 [Aspergillus heteromorphus CBS 117.55]
MLDALAVVSVQPAQHGRHGSHANGEVIVRLCDVLRPGDQVILPVLSQMESREGQDEVHDRGEGNAPAREMVTPDAVPVRTLLGEGLVGGGHVVDGTASGPRTSGRLTGCCCCCCCCCHYCHYWRRNHTGHRWRQCKAKRDEISLL